MNEEILTERAGRAGIVRLNRPKALNALTLSMVRAIRAALEDFAADEDVCLVLLEGEGERAFCAGGDIRAIAESGRARDGRAAIFWREEYELNAAIASFGKPVVAFMDGIVMGGGAGLSMHAAHRIVTERTRFAMPEVGIGFIPDVGATWRLPKAPGGLGRYLALTGGTVGAADVIAAGLADAMVPSASLSSLRARLAEGGPIDEAIAAHATTPRPGIFAEHGPVMERAFSAPDIEGVLDALEADGGAFAVETKRVVLSRSPSSLRVTEALLTLGERSASLEECLQREFFAALGTLEHPDYYEGVRAAVIDKDRNPRWSPSTLAEVPPTRPDSFAPRPGIQPPFASESHP